MNCNSIVHNWGAVHERQAAFLGMWKLNFKGI